MSMEAMRWAMAFKMPLSHKAVLNTLAFHANYRTQLCNPGMALIMDECGLSERTVQECLRQLEVWGLVEVRGDTKGGRGRKTTYFLRTQNPAPETPFAPHPKRKPRNWRHETPQNTSLNPANGSAPYKVITEPNITPEREPELPQNTSTPFQHSEGFASRYQQNKNRLRNTSNRIAVLVDIWLELYPHSGCDRKKLYPRLGKIVRQAGGDTEFVLELMWRSAASAVQGDPIAYLQGAILREIDRRSGGRKRNRYPSNRGNRY